MKNHYLFCFLLVLTSETWAQRTEPSIGPASTTISAQAGIAPGGGGTGAQNAISFDYDAAGNQIKRSFIYLAARPANPSMTDTISTPKKEFVASDLYADISYYPNPVRSELYVKWVNKENQNMQAIEIYDLTGKLIRAFNNIEALDNTVVNFEEYPSGMYNLILIYAGGDRKTLKIVKQ